MEENNNVNVEQGNKNKKPIIISIIIIIILLIVIVFLMLNKKAISEKYNKNNEENPASQIEQNPEEQEPEEQVGEPEVPNGNEQTTTRIDESGARKLESTLISNVDGGYGLFFDSNNKVSIDDLNNPYLIAFNLKKYLATKSGMTSVSGGETIFKWPAENTQTWTWDKCIATSCDGDDYTKLYRVSKADFNTYMQKTYNTTNKYDLLSSDEGKTSGILGSTTVVDSAKDYYNILLVPKGGSLAKVRTEFVKYEEDDNFLYIYDKFVVCISGEGLNACYTNTKDSYSTEDVYFTCTEDKINECNPLNDTSFNNMKGQLFTYKHTFKKSNGNYYWVSSESFKGPNY